MPIPSPQRVEPSVSAPKRARPIYLLAAAVCLLLLAPLSYLPLSFVGFVADPRWSFGADRGAFRDYEIRSAWIMLIGSLLPPVLACLLAGVVETGRGTGRRWRALGAILIVSAVALASWKLSADIHTLLDTISTTWRPGL